MNNQEMPKVNIKTFITDSMIDLEKEVNKWTDKCKYPIIDLKYGHDIGGA